MEGNRRILPWIAIALSALALVVSLGSWTGSHWQSNFAPASGYTQSMPGRQGRIGPQANQQAGPQANQQAGPQANQQGGPQANQQGGQPFSPQGGQQFGRGGRGQPSFGAQPSGGLGRFFFWPLPLIGKLMKLAFVVLLIWLGLRLLSGRGIGSRGGRGGGASPSQPEPEQSPSTGETERF